MTLRPLELDPKKIYVSNQIQKDRISKTQTKESIKRRYPNLLLPDGFVAAGVTPFLQLFDIYPNLLTLTNGTVTHERLKRVGHVPQFFPEALLLARVLDVLSDGRVTDCVVYSPAVPVAGLGLKPGKEAAVSSPKAPKRSGPELV